MAFEARKGDCVLLQRDFSLLKWFFEGTECLEVRNGYKYGSVSLCPAWGFTASEGSAQTGKSSDEEELHDF